MHIFRTEILRKDGVVQTLKTHLVPATGIEERETQVR